MELYFAVFSLLPLALFCREKLPRSTAGFLAGLIPIAKMLAPVIAKGVGTLIGSKKASNAAKQAEEQKKLEAAQADAKAKADWEAQQNTPQAQAARYKQTLQYGRLAAGLGGLDKVPKSMASYYNSVRAMPEYTGTSSYVAPAKQTGKGWNIASGVMDALGYLDTSQLGAPKASAGLMGAGNAAAYQGATPMGGGMATSLLDPLIKKVSTGTR